MSAAETPTLTLQAVTPYLRSRGLVLGDEEVRTEELGGGISNLVVRATWADHCVIIKQALPRLRVATEWAFDQSRNIGEADCLSFLARWVPQESVPKVVFTDDTNHIFGMTCAPTGGTLWKTALMRGEVDLGAADRVGQTLAHIHQGAASDDEARERFWDQTVLVQGRLEPYYYTTARVHSDLASMILREADRLLTTRTTLVLGDYSPKNIFVYPDRVFLIDFEVAHWGDPAFDVSFCLTHLVLKATRFAQWRHRFLAAAHRFWQGYRSGWAAAVPAREEAVVRGLACLLLARIDGKSKIEYIVDPDMQDLVRACGRSLLVSGPYRVEAALARVDELLGGST